MRYGVPVIVVLLVFWAYVNLLRPPNNGHLAIGKKLEFSFRPLINTKLSPDNSQLSGKVVLINFWGTWCPPCRAEFPHMMKIEQKYGAHEKFEFISVSCEEVKLQQLAKSTQEFIDKQKAKFAVYHDLSTFSRRKLNDAMNQDSFIYPTTVLLDGEGVIRGLWLGFDPEEMAEVDAKIAGLLK